MKKIFSLIAIAATVLMASCSKDALDLQDPAMGGADSNEEVVEGDAISRFPEDGVASIALTIASPSQTRATDEYGNVQGDNYGEYNNGEAYEHTVENATLVLFKGKPADSELTYTLHSAYELQNTNWDPSTSNYQITKTGKIVQKIERGNLETGENLFALVILNRHNYFTIDNTNHTIKDVDGNDLKGETAKKCADILLNEANRNFAAQSFLMSNMPYATEAGTTQAPGDQVAVKLLYPVDNSSIYSSETDALSKPAVTTINVERALAKVEVTSNGTSFTTTDGQSSIGEVVGWFIDNTNPYTYVVRHCMEKENDPYATSAYGYLNYAAAAHPSYRFVSGIPVVPGKKMFRTFWAVDQNYDTPATNLTTKAGTIVDNRIMSYNPDGTVASGNLRPVGSYYYCTENTFDIVHQSVKNTTRVVVAVKFNNGTDFYTIAPGETGKIWNEEDLKTAIISQYLNRVYPAEWLATFIDGSKVTNPVTLFTATIAKNEANGTASASISLNTLQSTQLKSGVTVEDATTAWNNNYNKAGEGNDWIAANINLSYYKGGICYYAALIQHFGQSETPWEAKDEMENNTTVKGVYGTSSKDYLGRYGVVRNNWYKVNLTGIRTIGTPTVPTLDGDEPDDQVEKYIKVEINIMPWVIRYQDTTL